MTGILLAFYLFKFLDRLSYFMAFQSEYVLLSQHAECGYLDTAQGMDFFLFSSTTYAHLW